jgi:hypothetical protein
MNSNNITAYNWMSVRDSVLAMGSISDMGYCPSVVGHVLKEIVLLRHCFLVTIRILLYYELAGLDVSGAYAIMITRDEVTYDLVGSLLSCPRRERR